MSAVTAMAPDPTISAVPFGRLLRVELRKMTDTRAGFWLLVAIALATATIVVIFLFAAPVEELTYQGFVYACIIPQGFLLPVMAILVVTSEWSQRTGLVTFTLEPNRLRVAAAKLLAVTLLGLLALALALGLGALGNLLGMALQDGLGSWDVSLAFVRDLTILQLTNLFQGFAFALILMNSAAAIVLFFVLPTAWTILFSLVGWLADIAPWVDVNTATAPVNEGRTMQGEDWAHLAVAGTIWIVVPLVLGLVRLMRSEVKSA